MLRTSRVVVWSLGLGLGVAALTIGPPASAESDDLPDPLPEATVPADLEERVRQLEEMNRRLLERYESVLARDAHREQQFRDLETKYQGLLERIEQGGARPIAPPAPHPVAEPIRVGEFEAEFGTSSEPDDREMLLPNAGRSFPDYSPARELPMLGRIGEGIELVSPDEELSLGVRVLNQVDFKFFTPNDLSPAISGVYMPRTRFYFNGHLTRPIEYEVSFQRGVEGVLDLLDGFVNFEISEGFQLKIGRALVPYSFDWYDHLEPYFITPERSLFPLNFGLSRQGGLTAWGYLGDGRIEYALGGFSGGTIGIADENSTRDAVGYLNLRPFLNTERFPRLRYLNVGGSIAGGLQVQPDSERPLPLRTSIQSTENSREAAAASISFLDFEEDVRSLGDRFQGAMHLAYYGGGWSIESEVQAGRFQFAKSGLPIRPHVPVVGYHVTAAYFLTGEEIPSRTTIVPLRPFDPVRGRFGPGAIEAFARISQLHIGDEVFTFELADEHLWTRNTVLTDIGFNWYLNRFVKFYFDWQHAAFGSPVLLNDSNGLLGRNSDLFWIRCQIWF